MRSGVAAVGLVFAASAIWGRAAVAADDQPAPRGSASAPANAGAPTGSAGAATSGSAPAAESAKPEGSASAGAAASGASAAVDRERPTASAIRRTPFLFEAPPPPVLPPPPPLDMPLSLANRSLTLPVQVVAAGLTLSYDAPPSVVDQVANVGLDVAIGAGRRVELGLGAVVPTERLMLLDARALWQFFGTDAVQIGLGFDLGFLTADTGSTELTLRPAVKVPIAFMPINLLRFETGFSLEVDAPTDGRSPAYAAFASRVGSPTIAAPGIPFRASFHPAEFVFVAFESGVGLLEMRSNMTLEEVTDGFFAPLGGELGGTVPIDGRPGVDMAASFNVPYALIGREDPVNGAPWQIGVRARVFAAL